VNEKTDAPADQLPDRLSTDPKSPYYNEEVLSRDVGIRFKGVEKNQCRGILHQRGLGARDRRQRQGSLRQPAHDQGSRPGRAVFSRQAVLTLVIARSACDEAIHFSACDALDCFASLAMTT